MSSTQLAGAIVAELIAAGVNQVVLCPGSRSTPLAMALASAPGVTLHTRTDERVAGFLALGLATAAGSAAIVTTSGTAVGSLLPSVMEAYHSGVTVVVVSADRPGYLVGTGANQTTTQMGIFGDHVVAQLRLSSQIGAADPRVWRAGVRRVLAVGAGIRTRQPGPVHINAEFDEPLVPDDRVASTPQPGGQPDGVTTAVSASLPASLVLLAGTPRTVVVAGDASPQVGRAARQCASDAGLPLLAEPSSNARAGRNAIAGYRRLLADTATGLAADTERVLLFGHPTLSRPIMALLARPDVELIVVADRAEWSDPGCTADRICDAVQVRPGDPAWLARWRNADAALPQPLVDHEGPITGPELASTLWARLGPTDVLMVGASNPVRDLDVAPVGEQTPWVVANRGLAGIDGTISTAQGLALGTQRPVTVLLGDLAFLHDIGALARPLGNPTPSVRIVVADDDGGSIFQGLEVGRAQYAADFERLFAMPHGLDLAAIAAGFGVPATRIQSRAHLEAALNAPIDGFSVIVVPVVRNRAGVQ